MKRHGKFAVCLGLSLAFIVGLTPWIARADDGEKARPAWFQATSQVGPVGTIQSFGGVRVDERLIDIERTLWGGELVEVANGSSAHVRFFSVGQVTLSGGAAVRLSVRGTRPGEGDSRSLLIASLIEGQMAVELRPEAGAYIETESSALTAAGGATFRVAVSENDMLVHRLGGEVRVEPPQITPPSRYIVRPIVREQATGRVLKDAPGTVHTQVPVELARQVRRRKRPTPARSRFMPEQDEPANGIEIEFTLDPPTFGRLDPQRTRTNEFGVAYTNFTPLTDRGEARIITTVVENPVDKHIGKIVIGKPPGIFRMRNIIIGAAAIGAVVVLSSQRNGRPIMQKPPVIINPSSIQSK